MSTDFEKTLKEDIFKKVDKILKKEYSKELEKLFKEHKLSYQDILEGIKDYADDYAIEQYDSVEEDMYLSNEYKTTDEKEESVAKTICSLLEFQLDEIVKHSKKAQKQGKDKIFWDKLMDNESISTEQIRAIASKNTKEWKYYYIYVTSIGKFYIMEEKNYLKYKKEIDEEYPVFQYCLIVNMVNETEFDETKWDESKDFFWSDLSDVRVHMNPINDLAK